MDAKKSASESKNPIVAYFVGAFEEFGKVTWPTKEQAALLTGIVVAVSLLFALVLGAYDFGLSALYQWVLEQFSS
ncbi:preprotein translocase subunit SecE [Candidatus Peregrinibacteria bacterium]|nr:MAG: preprotein translocase subunit SecE [Candidatus Peregrinibacteria bacterium]